MPPKRKAALAAADLNVAPPAKRAAKGEKMDSASIGQKSLQLEKDLPKITSCAWPADVEDEDDETDKDPLGLEEQPREATDKGFPITKAAFELFKHILTEQEKREPDCHDMHISNDYAGYGMTEVLGESDFNKILFKKEISPIKKWSYMEALVIRLLVKDPSDLMMNDNSDGVKEILNLFITLRVTSLELLSEHSLIATTSAVPNVTICTLIMIKFLTQDARDFNIKNVDDIVRAANKAGVDWDFREEMSVGERDIAKLRKNPASKAKPVDCKKDWPSFKHKHPGGTKYDITKMSKAEKKKHA